MLFRFALIFALLSLSSALAKDPPAVLRIVSEPWPPFITDDPDMPGIDVEVIEAVFQRLEQPIRFRRLPWLRAVQMTESGEADALLNVFKTAERMEKFWYPETPMGAQHTAIFCKDCNVKQLLTPTFLNDKVIIVNRGYLYSGFANDTSIPRIVVDNFEQGFRLLERGRGDYYLVNSWVGQYTLSKLNYLDIYPINQRLPDPSPPYLAFSKATVNPALVADFNRELKVFLDSNEYLTILHRYLPAKEAEPK